MSDQKTPEEALTEEFERSEIFSPEEREEIPETEADAEDVSLEDMDPKDAEIDTLRKELKEEKDKYFRLLAEMENARKRMQKEKQDMIRFTQENSIVDFLGPLDNFENALSFAESASEEVQNWAKGFHMIHTQFADILSSNNVTAFTSENTQFDPHLHEVIEIEHTDAHEEGLILKEFAKGYKCGDRIIRPARVKIAKKPVSEDTQKEASDEQEK